MQLRHSEYYYPIVIDSTGTLLIIIDLGREPTTRQGNPLGSKLGTFYSLISHASEIFLITAQAPRMYFPLASADRTM